MLRFALSALALLAGMALATDAGATFSIVAVDSTTQEVGSAGASCIWGASLISDVHPGVGAIHTQALWNIQNQNRARIFMNQGLSPEAIIDSLVANDVEGDPTVRQYGIVDLVGGGRSAGYTGINCMDYKNHQLGPTYAVAGNILLGAEVLDAMEQAFLTTPGPLADRLMATLQAANIPGADSRCLPDRPARSAFIRVARFDDPVTNLTLDLDVYDTATGNPIDMLQDLYNEWKYGLQVVDLDPPVASGHGAATDFDVEISYLGAIQDDVTIALDRSALPGGWSAELQWGATIDPDSITIPDMSPNQVEDVIVRVIPSPDAGVGTVTATTWAVSNPGTVVARDYHAFVRTPAILFVDDDNGDAFETIFEDAIRGAGYFEATWDLASLGRPSTAFLNCFHAVVWSTGELQTLTLGGNIQQSLMDYLDGGGTLFLSSQGYLNHQGITTFTSDYLGVTAFAPDAGATQATGRAGDPIGDGLGFPLAPPFPDSADVVTASPSSIVWLDGPSGPIGVRYDGGPFRSVFMTAAYEGVPAGSRDVVVGRILDWLLNLAETSGVPPSAEPETARVTLGQGVPNPFVESTHVRLAVPKPGFARLTIHDVAGRLVRVLIHGELPAGDREVAWDGRDDAGARVGGGIYFVRLDVDDVSRTRKVVFLGGR